MRMMMIRDFIQSTKVRTRVDDNWQPDCPERVSVKDQPNQFDKNDNEVCASWSSIYWRSPRSSRKSTDNDNWVEKLSPAAVRWHGIHPIEREAAGVKQTDRQPITRSGKMNMHEGCCDFLRQQRNGLWMGHNTIIITQFSLRSNDRWMRRIDKIRSSDPFQWPVVYLYLIYLKGLALTLNLTRSNGKGFRWENTRKRK